MPEAAPPTQLHRRPFPRWLWSAVRAAIVGLVFYLIVRSLFGNWHQLKEHDFSVEWRLIAASYLVLWVYLLNRSLLWHYLTCRSGCGIAVSEAIAAWFYSLLGKYVPGKVFMLAGRLHFYRQEGRGAASISMCFVLETVCVLLAAIVVLLVSPLFAPSAVVSGYRIPGLVLLVVFFIAIRPRHLERLGNSLLRLLRRSPVKLPLRYRHVLIAVAMYTLNWTLLGAGFLLYVDAVYPVPIHYLVYLAGSFALATTIGILAVFAPAGLGVREGVLMLALSAIMPQGMAAVVTLGARLWMSLGELLAVGAVALVTTFRRRFALRPGGSGQDASSCRER